MLLFLKFIAFVLSLMNIIYDVVAYLNNENPDKDNLILSSIFGKDMLLFMFAVILLM